MTNILTFNLKNVIVTILVTFLMLITAVVVFSPQSVSAQAEYTEAESEQIIDRVLHTVSLILDNIRLTFRSADPGEQRAQVIPTGGLVGHWAFDDGSGSIASDSTGNQDGVLHGPTWTSGRVGSGALRFDGVDDYVEIDDHVLTQPISNGASVFAWVNFDSTSGQRHIFDREFTNFNLAIWDGELVCMMRVDGQQYNSPGYSVSTGSWYHAGCVYDAGTGAYALYVNGNNVEEMTVPTGGMLNNANEGWIDSGIGGQVYVDGSYVDGMIDDVRVYNRDLSSVEVSDLYDATSGGTPPPPTAPTASLSASDTSIYEGDSTTLSWSSTDASSCVGTNFGAGGNTSGSVSVSPTSDTTYSISCTGAGGSDSDSVTVTVSSVSDPTYACSDSIDNDSDGLTDYPNDPGCTSTTDDNEYNAPTPPPPGGVPYDLGTLPANLQDLEWPIEPNTNENITVSNNSEFQAALSNDGVSATVEAGTYGNATVSCDDCEFIFEDGAVINGSLTFTGQRIRWIDSTVNGGPVVQSGLGDVLVQNMYANTNANGGTTDNSFPSQFTPFNRVALVDSTLEVYNGESPSGWVLYTQQNAGGAFQGHNFIVANVRVDHHGGQVMRLNEIENLVIVDSYIGPEVSGANGLRLHHDNTDVLIRDSILVGGPVGQTTNQVINGLFDNVDMYTINNAGWSIGIGRTCSNVELRNSEFYVENGAGNSYSLGCITDGGGNSPTSLAWDGVTVPDATSYGADHGPYAGTPPPTYACSDGIDNDSDGLTDYPNDPGCTSTTDNDEYNAPDPDPSATFEVGDRIAVNTPGSSLNVRATANGTVLGTQNDGALGTIQGGPTNTGGYDWWNVDFDTAPDGWVAEEFLLDYTAQAPIVVISATPSSITEGDTAALAWSSANADSCTGTNFSTSGNTSGAVSVSPTNTTTYSISCTGAGGSDSDSVTVTVSSVSDPTYACSDSIDNDSDGLTDYPNDPGCTSTTDDNEYNAPTPPPPGGVPYDLGTLPANLQDLEWPIEPNTNENITVSNNSEFQAALSNDGVSATVEAGTYGDATVSCDDCEFIFEDGAIVDGRVHFTGTRIRWIDATVTTGPVDQSGPGDVLIQNMYSNTDGQLNNFSGPYQTTFNRVAIVNSTLEVSNGEGGDWAIYIQQNTAGGLKGRNLILANIRLENDGAQNNRINSIENLVVVDSYYNANNTSVNGLRLHNGNTDVLLRNLTVVGFSVGCCGDPTPPQIIDGILDNVDMYGVNNGSWGSGLGRACTNVTMTNSDFYTPVNPGANYDLGCMTDGGGNSPTSLAWDGSTLPDASGYGADHGPYAGTPPPTYACSDGIDNDSDGLTDYPNDPGCTSTTDNDEYNAPDPDPSATFEVGDRIAVNTPGSSLNVRATANGTVLGTQNDGALGTIQGGPTNTGGYDWWNVDFDTAPDGWVAEEFLLDYTAQAPIVVISATPSSITEGDSTILGWSSANADSCTGTNFSTSGNTSDAVSVSPTNTTTYSISCTGAGGSDSDSVTVTVTPVGPPPPSGDYRTVIKFGDTQHQVGSWPASAYDEFTAMIDWVIANKDTENIDYVLHPGDAIDHGTFLPLPAECANTPSVTHSQCQADSSQSGCYVLEDLGARSCSETLDTTDTQWQRFNDQWSRLEPDSSSGWDGIPYAIVRGNHDNLGTQSDINDDLDTEGFHHYYDTAYFEALEDAFSGNDRFFEHENDSSDGTSHVFRFNIGDNLVRVVAPTYIGDNNQTAWAVSEAGQHQSIPLQLLTHYWGSGIGVWPEIVEEMSTVAPQLFGAEQGHTWQNNVQTELIGGDPDNKIVHSTTDYSSNINSGDSLAWMVRERYHLDEEGNVTGFSADTFNPITGETLQTSDDMVLLESFTLDLPGGTPPPPTYACNDGADNDSDGLIDYPEDPGCTSATDDDEYNVPPTPTASLSASDTSIDEGDSTTLTWSSTDASSCTGTNFGAGGNTSGSVSVSPTSDTTYSISCTGAGGSDSDSITIDVTPTPAPNACEDGTDNDSDGLIDYPEDPGCTSATDDDEYNVPPDTTAPTISNVSVGGVTEDSATISWTTDELATSEVVYGTSISYGESSGETSNVFTSHSVTISGLQEDREYHFQVSSRDAAGNSAASADDTFTTLPGEDVTAPSVSITSPSGGDTVSGTITLTAVATDPTVSGDYTSGVAGVQFVLDGGNFGSEDVTSPYDIGLDTTTLSDGAHTISATARDNAGNSSAANAVTFTVDNTPVPPPDTTTPVISDVSAERNSDTSSYTYTISWTTDEPATSLVMYGTNRNNLNQTVDSSSLNTSHSLDLSGLTRKTRYYYAVTSVDAAGNSATSDTESFRASGKPPSANRLTARSGSIILEWDPIEDVEEIVIIRRNGNRVGDTDDNPLVTLSGDATTYTDETAEDDRRYTYTVYSVDEGEYSDPSSVTFRNTPDDQPELSEDAEEKIRVSRGGGSSKRSKASDSTDNTKAKTTTVSPVAPGHAFKRDLSRGTRHEDIRQLQITLNKLGYLVSVSGKGSVGNETNYFGLKTEVALKKYQKAKGIVSSGYPHTTGYGNLGPKTRSTLNTALAPTAPSSDAAILSKIQVILLQIEELKAKLEALKSR